MYRYEQPTSMVVAHFLAPWSVRIFDELKPQISIHNEL